MVTTTTLLSDTVLFIRNMIRTNVTDPITSVRPTGENFVMTSYPREIVHYPLITVADNGIQDSRAGQQSEIGFMRLNVEVRVWARTVKERDNLFEQVYNCLRTRQFDAGTGLYDNNLHDFKLVSAVNTDEDGEEGVKSKVMTYSFLYVTE